MCLLETREERGLGVEEEGESECGIRAKGIGNTEIGNSWGMKSSKVRVI